MFSNSSSSPFFGHGLYDGGQYGMISARTQPFQRELEEARMENTRLNRLLQECEQEMVQMNNQRLRELEDMKLRHGIEIRELAQEKDTLLAQIEATRRTNDDDGKHLRMEIRERQEEIDRLQAEMQELVDENTLLRAKTDENNSLGAAKSKVSSRYSEDDLVRVEELEAALEGAREEILNLREKNEMLEDVLEEKNVQIVALTKFEREVDAQIRQHLAERDEKLSELELHNTMLCGKLAVLEEERHAGGATNELKMLLREREMEIEALDTHAAIKGLQTELQNRDDELIRLQRKALGDVDEFARGFSSPDALKKIDELERSLREKERNLTASRVELSTYLSEVEDILQENRYLRQVAEVPLDKLIDLTDMKIAERLSCSRAIAQLRVLEQRELEWDHERVKLRRKILELSQMVAEKGVMCHGLDADKLIYLQEFAKSLREGSILPPRDDSHPIDHSMLYEEEISKLKSEVLRLQQRLARCDEVPKLTTEAKEWNPSAIDSISAAVG
ncbi:conserved hypothetical protein [Perkinsus marinus ATCC 50983]|uniref:Uncharacterized protein n=1 Tax=Perkinsus marinus (strain ATCC 50983 / TXsc) TaxID=423536 RepID=C5LNH6_PERM5|nr:conserved hypothetical protein [Perkinsus marinus ATCC 50983]EER01727.1 conserved hypothetical protein [Perkinsus marinus ATCC 50983]|eukprot:XP_002769009.1 conserved hypothetical protein [Perkinsus marinus ATCC 50983]